MKELNPTLWRTCRVLANKRRLKLLRAVFATPDAPVKALALDAKTPPEKASAGLRLLQSRGLIHAEPRGKFVHYSPVPDPSVNVAARIVEAVGRAVDAGMPDEEIFKTCTAFTHPRRLKIVGLLAGHGLPLPATSISALTGISPPATSRHLAKLSNRRILVQDKDERWHFASKLPSQLAVNIVAIIKKG
jgi:DNA-binding transcriptional ArsR family regulator